LLPFCSEADIQPVTLPIRADLFRQPILMLWNIDKARSERQVTEVCGWLVPAGFATYILAIDLAC
jgi:hypothetical protein